MKRYLPTPATAIALIALICALSGSAYAAVTINGKDIRKGTIAGAQIKDGSLTGAAIRNGSVRGSDLAAGGVGVSRGSRYTGVWTVDASNISGSADLGVVSQVRLGINSSFQALPAFGRGFASRRASDACTGSFANPTARSGYLCFYAESERTNGELKALDAEVTMDFGRPQSTIKTTLGPESSYVGRGSWAYSIP